MAVKYTLPLGMLFRKMYCVKCGTKLKRDKVENIYKSGDVQFQRVISGIVNVTSLKEISYVYRCPECTSVLSYEEQKILNKIQKKLQKKVLSEREIRDNLNEI